METEQIATRISTSTSTDSIEVEINDTQTHVAVETGFLEGLVRRTLLAEGVENASISIALVDDSTIRVINRRHLAHDWPTDVISFGLSEPDDRIMAGELIVSAEMAAATAKDVGVDPLSELALYVVHGLLHLCGLDDQSTEDADVMRRREGEILAAEGLINTYPLVGLSKADEAGLESVRCPR
jgi:probable rRNA maturation factor